MTSIKPLKPVAALAMAGLLALFPARPGMAQAVQDDLAILRTTLQADRTALVAEALQLSEEEGKAFWPLYREYRGDLEIVSDGLVKLVLEYADLYPDVPEERASQMLKEYTALERKFAVLRGDYLKKASKKITAAKALRLAQVENRLDLAVRLQMANAIPLVPVKADAHAN